MKVVVAERQFTCTSTVADVWRAVSDTNRLNHALGMAPLSVVESGEAGAARYLCKTRLAGLSVEYEELPFEWREESELAIQRHFRNGPAEFYQLHWELAKTGDGGTQAHLKLEVMPRLGILRPFIKYNTSRYADRLQRAIVGADAELSRGSVPFLGTPITAANPAALQRAGEALRTAVDGKQLELVESLLQYVRTAPDLDVNRIRPYELAERWGASRSALLTVCLQAVMSGLFELSWDVICPSCRTSSGRVDDLAELSDAAHCHLCDLRIGVEFDRTVEASFRTSPAVRAVEDRPYCIGGPQRTPHVFSQQVVRAEDRIEMVVPALAGRYRLFVRGGATASVEVAEGGVEKARLEIGETVSPGAIIIKPGGVLEIDHRWQTDRHLKLEALEWASLAASAHDVAATDAFRRMFSTQMLRPGHALKVGRVSLLFTDLARSTELYGRIGDAAAYALVQDHFALLETVIKEHEGALVKTIGDAVMAVFHDEANAVKAAVSMQAVYAKFAKEKVDAAFMALRIGLYVGAGYAVTANESLDYFGQTVNLAARLQGVAEGGEIVIPADLADRAAKGGWLTGARESGRFSAALKGMTAPIEVARVRLVGDLPTRVEQPKQLAGSQPEL